MHSNSIDPRVTQGCLLYVSGLVTTNAGNHCLTLCYRHKPTFRHFKRCHTADVAGYPWLHHQILSRLLAAHQVRLGSVLDVTRRVLVHIPADQGLRLLQPARADHCRETVQGQSQLTSSSTHKKTKSRTDHRVLLSFIFRVQIFFTFPSHFHVLEGKCNRICICFLIIIDT